MPKTYYMHTINGKPAYFTGNVIFYMNLYGKASPLAKSLQQIKKEQAISLAYRHKAGWYSETVYSHRRVSIDD